MDKMVELESELMEVLLDNAAKEDAHTVAGYQAKSFQRK